MSFRHQRLVIFLLLVCLGLCTASSGDNLPEYKKCVETCTASDPIELPLYLRFLGWTHAQECRYQCMHALTSQAIENDGQVHQFHGKWPFNRILGIQEPAAVLFSIGNGLFHYHYYKKLQRQLPDSYPLKRAYLVMAIIAMNAWVWSTVFHTRDFELTERLDYFSAGLYILYGFYIAVVRIFGLGGVSKKVFMGVCAAMFVGHVTYLSTCTRFDYGYNMLACIVIGTFQTQLWLIWTIVQYTPWGNPSTRPFAWMAGLSVILISCAMGLEVFDFPPWFGAVDAHALWHAATIPVIPLFYQFILKDIKLDIQTADVQATKKRSS
ncbi:putative Mn2+ homeostasis protein [Phycomyces nitens]|nr:putative Mn2+ homeostasis protein [Phycomyces nitens]